MKMYLHKQIVWKIIGLIVQFLLIKSSMAQEISTLVQLPLEELMEVPIVTSVSKKTQALTSAPAAVFVLTQEDIRRSGVTTIADALRLVPGIQVARYNAHGWAVTSRGFNGFFATKLLVLVDGRSVYNTEFSGVYWDSLDMILADIERIEVIRGPGGTLWGANAMNGVVNIITRSAKETQGSLLKVIAGDELLYSGEWRHGGKLAEMGADFRVFAKVRRYDGLADVVPVSDAWDMAQAGFRLDSVGDRGDSWTVQGEVYHQSVREVPILSEGGLETKGNIRGMLSVNGTQQVGDVGVFSTQAYLDMGKRHAPDMGVNTAIFDWQMQYLHRFNAAHEVNAGVSYRLNVLDAYTRIPNNGFIPPAHSEYLLGAFVQHEWAILPEQLTLTLGSKFEYSLLNDIEFQPNIRLLWQVSPQYSIWAAVSRAIRTQSLVSRHFRVERSLPSALNPFLPLDLVLISEGNTSNPEELLAYELGSHLVFSDTLTMDIATFYNKYSNITDSIRRIVPDVRNGRVVLLNQVSSASEGMTYGMELNVNWLYQDWWRLQGVYSFFAMDLTPFTLEGMATAMDTEQNTPRHQFSLRSMMNFGTQWEVDAGLRYVDGISVSTVPVDAYWQLDARVAYQLSKEIELSLVGQNLLDGQQDEFGVTQFNGLYRQNERSVYGQFKWEFE